MWSTWVTGAAGLIAAAVAEGTGGRPAVPGPDSLSSSLQELTSSLAAVSASTPGAIATTSSPADTPPAVSYTNLQESAAAITAAQLTGPAAGTAEPAGEGATASSQFVSIVTTTLHHLASSTRDALTLQDKLPDPALNSGKNFILSDQSPPQDTKDTQQYFWDSFAKENKNNGAFQPDKPVPELGQLLPDVTNSNVSIASALPSENFFSEPQNLIQHRTSPNLNPALHLQSGILNSDSYNQSSGVSRWIPDTGVFSSSSQYTDVVSPLTESPGPDMGNLFLDTPRPESGINPLGEGGGLSPNTDVPYSLAAQAWNYSGNLTGRVGAILEEDPDTQEFGLAQYLWIYVAPVILITGCIGNILILLVMAKGKFKGKPHNSQLLLSLFAISIVKKGTKTFAHNTSLVVSTVRLAK